MKSQISMPRKRQASDHLGILNSEECIQGTLFFTESFSIREIGRVVLTSTCSQTNVSVTTKEKV